MVIWATGGNMGHTGLEWVIVVIWAKGVTWVTRVGMGSSGYMG